MVAADAVAAYVYTFLLASALTTILVTALPLASTRSVTPAGAVSVCPSSPYSTYSLPAAVVVVSGTAVAAALLKAILAITATIIVAGVVYYAAKSAIARLKRDQPQVHYYYAYLQSGDNVYIGPRIKSQSAAATVLRAGHNVFAISSGYAYNACKSASPISRVSSRQKHSGGGKNYYHYHPMITTKKQSHAHCWFI